MKKKSAKKASEQFKEQVESIESFLERRILSVLTDSHLSWMFDYAIIRLYREFENRILNCLVAGINNNTEQLSETTGVIFPKHITEEVCEYIVVGDGYFDFRGRDGLIATLKKYLKADHYLVIVIKKRKYKDEINRLPALRNFAAHGSRPSKERALQAIGAKKMSSSGAWLKKQNIFWKISTSLKKLADEIHRNAPY